MGGQGILLKSQLGTIEHVAGEVRMISDVLVNEGTKIGLISVHMPPKATLEDMFFIEKVGKGTGIRCENSDLRN